MSLAQVAVCIWLYVYTAGFAPIVGDPVSHDELRKYITKVASSAAKTTVTTSTVINDFGVCWNNVGLYMN